MQEKRWARLMFVSAQCACIYFGLAQCEWRAIYRYIFSVCVCACVHVCACMCACMCVWVRGLIVSVLLIHSFTHSNSLISPSLHRRTKLRWYPFYTQVLSIQWKEENEVHDNKMDLSAKKFVLRYNFTKLKAILITIKIMRPW